MSYHGLGQTTPPLIAETAAPRDAEQAYLRSRQMTIAAVAGVVVLGALAAGTATFAFRRRR